MLPLNEYDAYDLRKHLLNTGLFKESGEGWGENYWIIPLINSKYRFNTVSIKWEAYPYRALHVIHFEEVFESMSEDFKFKAIWHLDTLRDL